MHSLKVFVDYAYHKGHREYAQSRMCRKMIHSPVISTSIFVWFLSTTREKIIHFSQTHPFMIFIKFRVFSVIRKIPASQHHPPSSSYTTITVPSRKTLKSKTFLHHHIMTHTFCKALPRRLFPKCEACTIRIVLRRTVVYENAYIEHN